MKKSDSTIEKKCTVCDKEFRIFVCRDWREHECSTICKIEARKQRSHNLMVERTLKCVNCGNEFVAKKSQLDAPGRNYCSISCSSKVFSKTEDFLKARVKGLQTRREGLASGRLQPQVFATGKDSPFWKGGRLAFEKRQKEKGSQKVYRDANPEKVREWSQRRHGRKTGRLPRGTVKSLLERQRCRCAICTKSIRDGYHVDHVMPLALGGKHEPLNIQILCPSCNVRKNAKHPIRYAQELGMLL